MSPRKLRELVSTESTREERAAHREPRRTPWSIQQNEETTELRERIISEGRKETVCGDHTGPGTMPGFDNMTGKAPDSWATK